MAALLNAKEVTRDMHQHDHFEIALVDARRFLLCYLLISTKAELPFGNKRSPQQMPFTTIACQQHDNKSPRFAAVAGLARVPNAQLGLEQGVSL